MPETKNGNGNGTKWITAIIWVGTVIFAAGGGWVLLNQQAKCNDKQDVKLDDHEKRLQSEERRGDVILERLDYIIKAIDRKP